MLRVDFIKFDSHDLVYNPRPLAGEGRVRVSQVELTRQKMRDTARRLRTEQTDAEAKLWARLRGRQMSGAKFRRQHPIGPYVADFCCVEHGLIVEIDGSQHMEQVQSDQRRTAVLKLHGFRVLRFWNNEVLENIEAVVEQIYQALKEPSP